MKEQKVPLRKGWKIAAIIFTVLYAMILFLLLISWETSVFVLFTIILGIPAFIFWRQAYKDRRAGRKAAAAAAISVKKTHIDRQRYESDPAYREKVTAKIHKQADAAYEKKIQQAEKLKEGLVHQRTAALAKLSESRWVTEGKLRVNMTEGKVIINNNTHLFSSIKGAEINSIYGTRVVSQTTEKGNSKKHASVGGALVGSMVAGPVGAVVGGTVLGKTKSTSNTVTTSNHIPTCEHLGVNINIDGFVTEVPILTRSVAQSSMVYTSAMNEAATLVGRLQNLASTPVPQTVPPLEEDGSIKELDQKIADAEEEIRAAKEGVPTYELPD